MGCLSSKPQPRRQLPPPVHTIAEKPPARQATQPPRPILDVVETAPALPPSDPIAWYWQEEAERLEIHSFPKLPGNFVAYPETLSRVIETNYQQHLQNPLAASLPLELSYKAFGEKTGMHYRIDFGAMKQENVKTAYKRPIRRADQSCRK